MILASLEASDLVDNVRLAELLALIELAEVLVFISVFSSSNKIFKIFHLILLNCTLNKNKVPELKLCSNSHFAFELLLLDTLFQAINKTNYLNEFIKNV